MTKQQKIDDTLFNYDLVGTDLACDHNITGAMIEIQRYNFKRGLLVGMILVGIISIFFAIHAHNRLMDEVKATNYYYSLTTTNPQ